MCIKFIKYLSIYLSKCYPLFYICRPHVNWVVLLAAYMVSRSGCYFTKFYRSQCTYALLGRLDEIISTVSATLFTFLQLIYFLLSTIKDKLHSVFVGSVSTSSMSTLLWKRIAGKIIRIHTNKVNQYFSFNDWTTDEW